MQHPVMQELFVKDAPLNDRQVNPREPQRLEVVSRGCQGLLSDSLAVRSLGWTNSCLKYPGVPSSKRNQNRVGDIELSGRHPACADMALRELLIGFQYAWYLSCGQVSPIGFVLPAVLLIGAAHSVSDWTTGIR